MIIDGISQFLVVPLSSRLRMQMWVSFYRQAA